MSRKNGKKLLIVIAVGAVVVKAVRDVIKAKKQEEALKTALCVMLLCHMRSSFSMPLLYHAYVYLEFLILACTIYILASLMLLQPWDGVHFADILAVLLQNQR